MHPNHSKCKVCLSKWLRGGGFVRLWDALPCLRCHTVSESWLHDDFRHGFTGSNLTCWARRIIESCLNRLAQGKCRARCGDRSQQHGLWWWDCKAIENYSQRVACQVMYRLPVTPLSQLPRDPITLMFCNLNTLKSLVCNARWHIFRGSSSTLSPKPDNYYKEPLAPIMLNVYLWISMIQKKSWALARVQYATIIDDHRRIYSVNELIMTLISMGWCNFNDMSVATLSCTPDPSA